jgi:hypothetical protein
MTMGFGDFLSEAVSAGASALGVDTDDIGGLFEQAKGALGGDTDDLFGAAAQQLGIDSDDITSAVGAFGGGGGASDTVDQIGRLFGGGGDATSGTGGGFAGIVSGFLGEDGGDVGGVAQQALGGFGALLSGGGAAAGDGGGGVAAFLPDSVRQAFSEAADLPIVQDAAGGDWATIASSVPGLDGALGSFGLSTKGVAEHIEAVGTQAVDGGSAWSIGSMLADHGTQFLSAVAAPVNADSVWSSLPGVAQSAGVELPGWASGIAAGGLLSQGGRMLPEGGFMPAEATDDPWGMSQSAPAQATPSAAHVRQPDDASFPTSAASDTDDMSHDTTGESQVAAQADDSLDAFDAPLETVDDDGLDPQPRQEGDYSGDDLDPATIQPAESPESPTFDEPAPAPDPFAAADELEDSLGDLGDDIG